jgi:hypothetical protein
MFGGCGKPAPADWCWDGRDLDCHLDYPPRWAAEGNMNVWRCLKQLHEKQRELEEHLLRVEFPED